jgi:endosialidase-like protein
MSGAFPLGPENTPNWLPGYVPPAEEWNQWFSNKVDYDDPRVSGGPFVPISGGSMTGPLLLYNMPSQPLEAATKSYVDQFTPVAGPFLPMSGGTMTGLLTLALDPSGAFDAVTKRYADTIGSTANNALTVAQAALARSGGTMTGPLVLGGDPVNPLAAATKQYVDRFVPLAGASNVGTIATSSTGDLYSGRDLYAANNLYLNSYNNFEWNFYITSNGSKVQAFRSGWYNQWDSSSGMRAWNSPSGTLMSLDNIGNLFVADRVTVGGDGIIYQPYSSNSIGYSWNGSAVQIYVNRTAQGSIATQSYVGNQVGQYLPLAGGHITGSLGLDGPFNFTNNGNVSGTLGIGSYGTIGGVGWYYEGSGGANGFQFFYNGSVVCRLDGSTDIVLASSCDASLKQDIAPSEVNCLDVIRRTPLFQFRWKDIKDAPLVPLGFVAQEQEKVFPASVGGELTKSIDPTVMVAALVGAVQQLSARVEAIEGRWSAAMRA